MVVLRATSGTGARELTTDVTVTVTVTDVECAGDDTTTCELAVGASDREGIETAGDTDWFEVELTADTTYLFEVAGGGGSDGLADPVVRLFDADGDALVPDVVDADADGDGTAGVTFTPGTDATFYVEASEDGDDATGTYTVSVTDSDCSAGASTLCSVAVGGSVSGEVGLAGDVDWFAVELVGLTVGDTYLFEVAGGGGSGGLVDPVVRLFDADGDALVPDVVDSDADGDGTAGVGFTPGADGSYFVAVSEDGDDGTGTYTVSVSEVFNGIEQLSVGNSHVCAVLVDASVSCWGSNDFGEGSPPGGVRFVQVAAGFGYACGLAGEGSIMCWGSDRDGRATPAAGTDFVAVVGDEHHGCGLRRSGVAVCWGNNSKGQRDVPPGVVFSSLAAGYRTNCGLQADHAAVCWGSNDFGERSPPAGVSFSVLSLGLSHGCGIKTDQSVVCWGHERAGKTAPPSGSFSAIASSWESSCGVNAGGTIQCWGRNEDNVLRAPLGQFASVAGSVAGTVGASAVCARTSAGTAACWGSGAIGSVPAGLAAVVSFGADPNTAPFFWDTTLGSVEVAEGAPLSKSVAVVDDDSSDDVESVVVVSSAASEDSDLFEVDLDASNNHRLRFKGGFVADFEDPQDSDSGNDYVVVLRATSGTGAREMSTDVTVTVTVTDVECAGDDTTTCELAVGATDREGIETAGDVDWFSVELVGLTVGDTYLFEVAGDGGSGGLADPVVRLFDADGGALVPDVVDSDADGDGTAGVAFTPAADGSYFVAVSEDGDDATGTYTVAVSEVFNGIEQISVGTSHVCAVLVDASVSCWGGSSAGEGSPPSGVRFVQVAAGWSHSCGLTSEGSITCWGNDSDGRATPPAGTDFVTVAGDADYSCGLRSSGVAVCWGGNGNGQRDVPSGVVFSSLAAGWGTTCGVKADHAAVCWGNDNFGQASPPSGVSFSVLSLGGSHGCGIKTDQSVVCWGDGRGGKTAPPSGSFSAIAASSNSSCGLTAGGTIQCWGRNEHNVLRAPLGQFASVAGSAGASAVCARTSAGTAACWGSGAAGSVPAGLAAVVSFGADPNTPPFFWSTTLDSVEVAEGAPLSKSVAVVEDDPSDDVESVVVVSSAASEDHDLFEVYQDASNNHHLRFTGGFVADFEDPQDSDTGNDYVVVLRATSGTGAREMSTDVTVTVTVTDVECAGDDTTTCELAVGATDREGIETAGDTDWFAVELTADTAYRINVAGGSGSGELADPVVKLFDADGSAVSVDGSAVEDADADDDGTAGVTFTPGTDATFYVEASENGDDATGTYTVSVVDSDCSAGASTLCSVTVGGSVSGEVGLAGDVDWFAVELVGLTVGNTYLFEVAGGGGSGGLADPVVRLFDADGDALVPDVVDSDADGDGTASVGFTPAADGSYFVAVSEDGDDGTGTYTVAVSEVFNGIEQFSVGRSHVCAVLVDASVSCWGSNDFGEGSPPGGVRFVQVAASLRHACGLAGEGSITCWGNNADGRATPAAGTDFVAVVGGADYSCGLRRSGVAVCWGGNGLGQGDVPSGVVFSSLAAGWSTTCGVQADHAAVCWGDDTFGEASPPSGVSFSVVSLGLSHGCGVKTDQSVECWGDERGGKTAPPSGSFSEIAASEDSSCGLTSGGTIQCWGRNEHNVLRAPLGQFVSVDGSARADVVCALTSAGTAACWGSGAAGTVPAGLAAVVSFGADPNTPPFFWSTTLDSVEVAEGAPLSQSVAVVEDDSSDDVESVVVVSSAASEDSDLFEVYQDAFDNHRLRFAGGFVADFEDPQDSDTGNDYVVVLRATSGTGARELTTDVTVTVTVTNVECAGDDTTTCELAVGASDREGIETAGDTDWFEVELTADTTYLFEVAGGGGSDGLADPVVRLFDADGDALVPDVVDADADGDGTAGVTFTPGTDATFYVEASEDGDDATGTYTVTVSEVFNGIEQISVGTNHACAVLVDASVSCWGSNSFGEGSPPGGVRFVQVAASWIHACGLAGEGSITCWGDDANGRATPPTGTDFVAVVGGQEHSCGLRSSGAAVCWGNNTKGQGDVPPGVVFSSLAAGRNTTCGVQADHAVVCWGDDNAGEASPPSGVSFSVVSLGTSHGCGIKTDQSVACWGDERAGKTAPPSGSFSAIAASRESNCGLTSGGTIQCWGRNEHNVLRAPLGQFVSVAGSARARYVCARTSAGTAACWGSGAIGSVPAGLAAVVSFGADPNTPPFFWSTTLGSVEVAEGAPLSKSVLAVEDDPSDDVESVVVVSSAASEDSDLFEVDLDASNNHRLRFAGGFVADFEDPQDSDTGNDYVVVLRATSGTGAREMSTDVTVTVTVTDVECAGDDTTTCELAVGATDREGIETAGDTDWFEVELVGLTVGDTYLFEVAGDGGSGGLADPVVRLFDADGDALVPDVVDSDADGDGTAGVGFTPGADGSYFVAVSEDGDDGTGTYTVSVSEVFNGIEQISVGANHVCAVLVDASVSCWGSNSAGEGSPPGGVRFVQVAASLSHACGLAGEGSITCWGDESNGRATPPAGTDFVAVVGGQEHSCGLRSSGAAVCWGSNTKGQGDVPPGVVFSSLAASLNTTCGVKADHAAVCWGGSNAGESSPPSGVSFSVVSLGLSHGCGIKTDQSVVCWGGERAGKTAPPSGSFSEIAASRESNCGLTSGGTIQCWGRNKYNVLRAPLGQFASVAGSASNSYVCALTSAGTAACWGSGAAGTVPAGLAAVVSFGADPNTPPFFWSTTLGSVEVAEGAPLSQSVAVVEDDPSDDVESVVVVASAADAASEDSDLFEVYQDASNNHRLRFKGGVRC